MKRVGIILAAGSGSRFSPITRVIPKQLLPVYDLPVINFSFDVMRRLNIKDVFVVVQPGEKKKIWQTIGDIFWWGCEFFNIKFIEQCEPKGMGHALSLCEKFIESYDCDQLVIMLGDNVISFTNEMWNLLREEKSPCIFGFPQPLDIAKNGSVIISKDKDYTLRNRVSCVVEKPHTSTSEVSLAGLYILSHQALGIAAKAKPSVRGEIELVDAINADVSKGLVWYNGRSHPDWHWFDTGTPQGLLAASNFVSAVRANSSQMGCFNQ